MNLKKTLQCLSLILMFAGISGQVFAENNHPDPDCFATGTVLDLSGSDGCGFVIELENGTIIQPIEILQEINLYDSMRVTIGYQPDSSVVSSCMAGIPAIVYCIREITSGPECSAQIEYERVPCEEWDSLGNPVVCNNYLYYFNAIVQAENPKIKWTINADTISDVTNFYYNFEVPGYYQVCLEVIGENNCAVVSCEYISIGDSSDCEVWFDYYPMVDITLNPLNALYPTEQLSYQFIGYSSGQAVEWYWSLNDSIFSTEQNATYTFPHYGEFTICLTARTADGCESTYCQTILVDSIFVECLAGFTAWPINSGIEDSTDTGTQIGYWFENRSFSYSHNVEYFWDFGDGSTSTEFSPQHYFNRGGHYTVCLSMYADSAVCSDIYCEVIYADSISECNAYFEYCNYQFLNNGPSPGDSVVTDTNNSDGYLIGFKNLSTPETAQFIWDFGDGNWSTDKNPVHKFEFPGTYYVCLYVYSWYGCSSTYCEWITVGENQCDIDFTVETLVPDCGGFQIAHMFTPVTNQTVSWYNWIFGDGENGWDEQPIHIFENYGVYNVCVEAYFENGCYATKCHDVYVFQDSINFAFKSACGVSPVHDLEIDKNNLALEKLYPVPAADNVEIKVFSNKNQDITIELTDMLGRKFILYNNYQVFEGENTVNLSLEQFSSGTYQYSISNGETVLKGSLIVLK